MPTSGTRSGVEPPNGLDGWGAVVAGWGGPAASRARGPAGAPLGSADGSTVVGAGVDRVGWGSGLGERVGLGVDGVRVDGSLDGAGVGGSVLVVSGRFHDDFGAGPVLRARPDHPGAVGASGSVASAVRAGLAAPVLGPCADKRAAPLAGMAPKSSSTPEKSTLLTSTAPAAGTSGDRGCGHPWTCVLLDMPQLPRCWGPGRAKGSFGGCLDRKPRHRSERHSLKSRAVKLRSTPATEA